MVYRFLHLFDLFDLFFHVLIVNHRIELFHLSLNDYQVVFLLLYGILV